MNSQEQPENDEFDVQAINEELINHLHLSIYGQNIKQMFDTEFDSQNKIVKFFKLLLFIYKNVFLQYDYAECSYPQQSSGKASIDNNSKY
jgi:hypothetical protein